mmetsp:Transcript_26387/g.52914  ORF Transcript_26387/g.52914 Transcript_26387/m.52914 type:complete len:814 (+) Transcript_26387:330-2771(+)
MSAQDPTPTNAPIGPTDNGKTVSQQNDSLYQQRPDSATSSVSSAPPSNEDHVAIFDRLRQQVEFYFSRLNLSRDTYLRNMLTATHPNMPSPQPAPLMTPIAVITNFPKVRAICDSFGRALPDAPPVLVARALQGSAVVLISPDGAWIGPASQQLPPMGMAPPRGPPQPHFQQGPTPQNLHQQRGMMPTAVHDGGVSMSTPYGQPTSRTGSPSSNSLESNPSVAKGLVFVAVMDLSPNCNPIEILGALTTETVRPVSASFDGPSNTWITAFGSIADAKAAIVASGDKTISGAPFRTILKSELSASKVTSAASASGASVSSQSDSNRPGAIPGGPQMVQQPIPMHGNIIGHVPSGYPVPQPGLQPMPIHVPPGGPPYPSLHYGVPPMQIPPGQQYPPYYNIQMQQMYPFYMQQHGQQHLPPYAPPPPNPMGMRFGPGAPPPPPPRYPGPGGPMPYVYPGMQQYGAGGDGYGHHHGHPPRHHGAGSGRGGGGGGSGGSGGASEGGHKKKQDRGNKKKRNNQSHKRDSVGSGNFAQGSDGEGDQRRSKNNEYQGNYSHDSNSSHPNSSQGNNRVKGKKDGDQHRRSYGGSSSSTRSQKNNNNRNATSPSKGTNEVDDDGKKEIFSAADFPGLGGAEKSSDNTVGKSAFSGYADALLKKSEKEVETPKEEDNAVVGNEDVDSITRQTEAIEREILSEFHDLSTKDNRCDVQKTEINDDKGESEGNSSTPPPSDDGPRKHLPILPGPFPDNDEVTGSLSAESLSKSISAEQEMSVLPAPVPADMDEPETTQKEAALEAPVPPKAWGTKRLFADVIKNKE